MGPDLGRFRRAVGFGDFDAVEHDANRIATGFYMIVFHSPWRMASGEALAMP